MKRWLTWPKIVFYALGLLLWAAWYVPQMSADRYREPIREALENALGRKVSIGPVQFRLLPVPGFTVSDVTVGEDPEIGPEPVAYITTLRARPRISALFGGPLAFASVDLEETSVNMTRVEKHEERTTPPVTAAPQTSAESPVQWNFSSLMRPKILATFPSVHMISGRVNFKFGDTKSVFYLLNTDVDLWPPTKENAPWTLRVRAEPARTDRPSHGFGSFTARGEWHQKGASAKNGDGSAVVLDVKLEKSELGDMVTLFEGRESGLHGDVWGNAHLAGPLSRVGLAGVVAINDIHGWNQTPPGGAAWTMPVSGAIDLTDQTIDVRALAPGKQPPVDLRYHVAEYLGRPRWGVTAILSQLPVAPLVDMARHFGWQIPADLAFDGMAQGAVGYSMPGGTPRMDGQVDIANSTLTLKGSPPVHLTGAGVRFSGPSVKMGPAVMEVPDNNTLTVRAVYDVAVQKLDVSIATERMPIDALGRRISLAGVPLLSQATGGTWSGDLHYSSLPAPVWAGDLHLTDAQVPFEAFSEPLHVVAADGTLDEAGVSMKRVIVEAAGMEGRGDYSYITGDAHPHRFHIALARLSGSAIEKLLMPALHRGNFLSYAFNFGRAPKPDWLRNMRADGTLQVGLLELGGTLFSKLRARMLWDGDEVVFEAIQAQFKDAAFAGSATVSLTQREPSYDVTGKLSGFSWQSGTLSANGSLSAAGTGVEFLAKMKGSGTFLAKNVDLADAGVADHAEGSFEWAWDTKNPVLRIPHLTIAMDGDTLQGTAESRKGGMVVVRATGGQKPFLAAGAVLKGEPLRLAANRQE